MRLGWFTHRHGKLASNPPNPNRASAEANRRSLSDICAGQLGLVGRQQKTPPTVSRLTSSLKAPRRPDHRRPGSASAIAAATSANTRPRSCTNTLGCANAFDNPDDNPVLSANIRNSANPACDTTPSPPTVTSRPLDQPITFTL